MALIEYDVYKQKLRDLEPELKKLGDALDIDAVAQEAARLEDETTQDGFWNNLERSQKVQTRLKQLQNKLHRFKKLMSTWEDLTTLCEMGQEAEDEELLEELKRRGIDVIDKKKVIDILKTAQIVTAKTNGFIDGFVSQIWVINDLLRKVIEKLGGEAYKVEQDGSIEYDDSENEKIKEFKEEK